MSYDVVETKWLSLSTLWNIANPVYMYIQGCH